jgi:putative protease
MRTLELLAPAKDLECGMAAVDHGADAVYIGAPRFGARVAAGNSIDDIRQLCDYARPYGVKVFVTVNTLLHADELLEAERLIWQVYEAGADAVLVQDMAVLELSLPPIALHASTQTDNRTAERVRWLRDQGFRRVVLARELSLQEITDIHNTLPDMPLEVFVHGALCVSYSGACYASEYCFGRSANRGACAQFCRMKFDLVDAEGREWEHQRHLLSLKDLNQYDYLEQLIEAGATSFKIEGRLKDAAYVKNVTAAYSERLNDIIRRHPDRYCRASRGRCTYTFTPDLKKTFNRGYTNYFLHVRRLSDGTLEGRRQDIFSPDTPKALGEYVGKVKELRRNSFNVAGTAAFANGDGLCFFDDERQLQGFRVNRVEGNRLFPLQMPAGLCPGTALYRNNDQDFERLLSRPSAERKIPVRFRLEPTADGFALSATGATGSTGSTGTSGTIGASGATGSTGAHVPSFAAVSIACEHQQAEKSQRDNIVRQLSKLGGTPYECSGVELPDDFNYFIPSSLLSELRRKWQTQQLHQTHPQPLPVGRGVDTSNAERNAKTNYPTPYQDGQGESTLGVGAKSLLLMQCRHCLRFSLGYCVKHGGQPAPWREPLFLRLGDGRQFRLQFDCRECQMNLFSK